jgi:hypothetical protein
MIIPLKNSNKFTHQDQLPLWTKTYMKIILDNQKVNMISNLTNQEGNKLFKKTI